jgi:adenosylcobinamide kinase / adenosylcobinamide-phosphate guanylyltransferase
LKNKSSQIILVTGAAQSGKSEWAEYLAENTPVSLIYIATGLKNEADKDWIKKITIHQQRRSSRWQTWEIPQKLSSAITKIPLDSCTLIDSLGTWVANYIEKDDQFWQKQTQDLIINLEESKSKKIIIVSEETGWGVVPAYEQGRIFRRRLGLLTRQIGSIADTVYLVVGGYAVDISKIGINLNQIDD